MRKIRIIYTVDINQIIFFPKIKNTKARSLDNLGRKKKKEIIVTFVREL